MSSLLVLPISRALHETVIHGFWPVFRLSYSAVFFSFFINFQFGSTWHIKPVNLLTACWIYHIISHWFHDIFKNPRSQIFRTSFNATALCNSITIYKLFLLLTAVVVNKISNLFYDPYSTITWMSDDFGAA